MFFLNGWVVKVYFGRGLKVMKFEYKIVFEWCDIDIWYRRWMENRLIERISILKECMWLFW
jgi:hypothetical protein